MSYNSSLMINEYMINKSRFNCGFKFYSNYVALFTVHISVFPSVPLTV